MDKAARVGCIFWVERQANADHEGFTPNGTYLVTCYTPQGQVKIWPYEYSVMKAETVIAIWQDDEILFHPADIEPARFNDIVFYARSRGISLSDATVVALGSITGPVGWFEPHPDLVPAIEAMEERVNRWKPRKRTQLEH